MKAFSDIQDGQAITLTGGVYRQVGIAVRDGRIYAKQGSGYVRLSQYGATSSPKVRWHDIDPGAGGSFEEKGGHVLYKGEVK